MMKIEVIFALILLATPVAKCSGYSGYQCTTDDDCELLGKCDVSSNKCQCSSGFTGKSCGSIDLLPIPTPSANNTSSYALWPDLPLTIGSGDSFSWGFTGGLYDENSKKYHSVVNVGCCDSESCGVVVPGTVLAHLSSDNPFSGPYHVEGIVTPPTSFNPHLMRAPNGTIMLYFRVNDLNNYTVCYGNGTTLDNSLVHTYVPKDGLQPGLPDGKGVNIYVAWSQSFNGPPSAPTWNVQKIAVEGMGDLHISNPSVTFLQSGKLMMSYRFNKDGEQVGFAISDSFLGPFRSLANLSHHSGNDEDPFLWQQPDGSLHALYHNGPYGYHAFSGNGGRNWTKSPTQSYAFTLNVSVDGEAETYNFARRERPEMLFDKNGRPAQLINGVNTKDTILPWSSGENSGLTGRDSETFAFSFGQLIKISNDD